MLRLRPLTLNQTTSPMSLKLRFLTAFVLIGFYMQAQQLSLFTQYREQAGIINPAALSGDYLINEQNLSFGISYRSQWTALQTTPRTQTLHGEYFMDDIGSVGMMFGGHLINDQTGPTGFTGLYGRIAGVLGDDPVYSGLSFGLSAGAVQYRVNTEKIRLREDGDITGMQSLAQIFPDVGLGVYYYRMMEKGFLEGDYIYAGASVPQVIGLELAFQDEAGEFFTKRIQHFYGQVGMFKFFDNDSFLEPSAWVKYAPNVPISADFNLRYQMAGSLWMGTGLSTNGNFHIETGFMFGPNIGFDNTFKIGYGFDYSFSSFGPSVGSTHEINLSIAFEK